MTKLPLLIKLFSLPLYNMENKVYVALCMYVCMYIYVCVLYNA